MSKTLRKIRISRPESPTKGARPSRSSASAPPPAGWTRWSAFSHMPPEPGLALVVVQHLDPNRRSIMPELLSR